MFSVPLGKEQDSYITCGEEACVGGRYFAVREEENERKKCCLDILASAVLVFILSYICVGDSTWFCPRILESGPQAAAESAQTEVLERVVSAAASMLVNSVAAGHRH